MFEVYMDGINALLNGENILFSDVKMHQSDNRSFFEKLRGVPEPEPIVQQFTFGIMINSANLYFDKSFIESRKKNKALLGERYVKMGLEAFMDSIKRTYALCIPDDSDKGYKIALIECKGYERCHVDLVPPGAIFVTTFPKKGNDLEAHIKKNVLIEPFVPEQVRNDLITVFNELKEDGQVYDRYAVSAVDNRMFEKIVKKEL